MKCHRKLARSLVSNAGASGCLCCFPCGMRNRKFHTSNVTSSYPHAWHFLFTIVNCVLWFLFHVGEAFFLLRFFYSTMLCVKGSKMAVRATINRILRLPNLLLSPIFIAKGIKDNFRWRWDDTTSFLCVYAWVLSFQFYWHQLKPTERKKNKR